MNIHKYRNINVLLSTYNMLRRRFEFRCCRSKSVQQLHVLRYVESVTLEYTVRNYRYGTNTPFEGVSWKIKKDLRSRKTEKDTILPGINGYQYD